VGGGHGFGNPRPRCGRHGAATRPRCGSWWPPLGPREQADHDQPALTAGRTEPTGLERGRRAGGRLALLGWGRAGCGRFGARQAALEVVPERPMGGTPEPIIADVVEPPGQHLRPTAPEALGGRPGPSRLALSRGVPVAAADVAVRKGE
jgi:hypothetical protein